MPDGPVGVLTASLAYQNGNEARRVEFDTSGSTSAYPEYVDGLLTGGQASVLARTRVAGGLTVGGSGRVSSDPFFNAFLPSGGGDLGPGLADLIPATGLYQQRSLSTTGSANAEQKFGSAATLTATFTYGRFSFSDGTSTITTPSDNTSQTVNTTYAHTLSPAVSLRANYSYGRFGFVGPELVVGSSTTQRIEAGLTAGRPPITLSIQAGAARLTSTGFVGATPFEAWLPSGSATLAMARQRWRVQALYARDFSLLQGVSTDVYVLDQASLEATWLVTRTTSLGVAGSYAAWQTPEASQVAATFNVLGAQLQASQKLGQRFSLVASYGYYKHEYSESSVLPTTFPPSFDRQSFRLGISVNVPLIGGGRRTRASGA
jgi:hypothetical protein